MRPNSKALKSHHHLTQSDSIGHLQPPHTPLVLLRLKKLPEAEQFTILIRDEE